MGKLKGKENVRGREKRETYESGVLGREISYLYATVWVLRKIEGLSVKIE